MYAEHVFLIFAVILVIGLGVHAWKNGVVGMLWGIIGCVGGLVGGVLLYQFIIAGLGLSFGVKLTLAFFGGLIIYLIVRFTAKALLTGLFEPEGPLHFLSDGFGGFLVSLVPSLFAVVILAIGVRVGGTLVDLRRFELFSTEGRDFLAKNYPKRPLPARWRDGIEDLPNVRDALDIVEPYGRPAERNLVGLLVLSKKPALRRHFAEDPVTKPIFDSVAFQNLLVNEKVQELNTNGERLKMLRQPDIRTAALDTTLRPNLVNLELAAEVDQFLLSREWQDVLESYQRDPNEKLEDPNQK
ncbi:MAG: hypothetical protein KDN19_20525 [Verrucomicrobiae bacterium]|nr:hypothetical protein [Verrucomicrobiae bacterium]